MVDSGGQRRPEAEQGPVRRRTFWWIFAGAWCVFGLVACSAALSEGASLGRSLVTAGAAVSSQLLPALVVVWTRSSLLRVDRPLPRTVGIHALVGVLYAVTGAGLLLGLALVLGLQPAEPWDGNWSFVVMAQVINGLILYFILLGFLMWTESVERIQEGRSMVAHARMLRAEAEAKALRAQFSPHFVFNALHSMIQLIRADPDAAERSIEDMAALIRYGSVLQKRATETVPLAVEAAVARRYLALEKMRLGGRLDCQVEIEAGIGHLAVPALTLQTLLENAVKHGIAPLEEGGSIELSIAVEGQELVIRVTDSGAGADPSTIGAEEDSGLRLLGRRLRNLYGEDSETGLGRASLRWDTGPDQGFTATVRLPTVEAQPMDVPQVLQARLAVP